MNLKDDLETAVQKIFKSRWQQRGGKVVPEDNSVTLDNDAITLDATVLYADLADSTKLVDTYKPHFAAEVYKAFLASAARVIRDEGGVVTAYDGDRIMAVYIGDSKNTAAVRASLKINWTTRNIIQPAMNAQYTGNAYVLRHVIGIDTGPLFVAKTGARGANDLVWVGRPANYAAKLATLPHTYKTYITQEIYNAIDDSVKTGSNGAPMWERVLWNTFDGRAIYRSAWWWILK